MSDVSGAGVIREGILHCSGRLSSGVSISLKKIPELLMDESFGEG